MVTLAEVPLLILVGLTGVGKTTTVDALAAAGLDFERLPGRRDMTDDRIIGFLQKRDGEAPRSVTDRQERFEYTRRYRELFPGGMAQALGGFEIPAAKRWQLFDGLRGRNEVEYASRLLPSAWFLVLTAPNAVRVERLLDRGDVFDQVAIDGLSSATAEVLAAHMDMLSDEPGGADRLQELVQRGEVSSEELHAKLLIVAKEHQNYSAQDTLFGLLECAPERTIEVRTDLLSPPEIADKVVLSLPRPNFLASAP